MKKYYDIIIVRGRKCFGMFHLLVNGHYVKDVTFNGTTTVTDDITQAAKFNTMLKSSGNFYGLWRSENEEN